MEYHINPLRWGNISTFAIVLTWLAISDYYGRSWTLFLLYLLFVVVFAVSIHFRFTIHEDHLVYRVLVFKKAIIKKVIYPIQIDKIEFIRAGWNRKAAILKTNEGENIRLVVLQPEEAYDHLIEFAEKQDISITKTDDYYTLERKGERRKMANK
ncbi:hypothetical protein [Gracilibacillus saliphilus]|uniref:hypothetical protein n=1 Tax=Gracilibacillus saliphilus TaxID=543890 RepID=UPI0013D30C2C|nr:hypothetical protein [Gracilibacillus saliphilus]